jgi:hypothetical protein
LISRKSSKTPGFLENLQNSWISRKTSKLLSKPQRISRCKNSEKVTLAAEGFDEYK